ncbi:BA75_03986T0 [Komagataella pastoris]|uniref:BA75_03986T0 n=1 Tax=Komagataella pastoris TaxID=4922 RepID=A0A1B2JGN7_PICPA|nr:BA75_03986T0 [Komagataella pastoris]
MDSQTNTVKPSKQGRQGDKVGFGVNTSSSLVDLEALAILTNTKPQASSPDKDKQNAGSTKTKSIRSFRFPLKGTMSTSPNRLSPKNKSTKESSKTNPALMKHFKNMSSPFKASPLTPPSSDEAFFRSYTDGRLSFTSPSEKMLALSPVSNNSLTPKPTIPPLPPRIKPFVQNSKSKKRFVNEHCVFCDEMFFTLLRPMETKSPGTDFERIVEFECGHVCHGSCLMVAVEFQDDTETGFPTCVVCSSPCLIDDKQFERNLKSVKRKTRQFSPTHSSLYKIKDFVNEAGEGSGTLNALKKTVTLKSPTNPKVSGLLASFEPVPNKDIEMRSRKHESKLSRGSSISAVSSLVSSADRTSPTETHFTSMTTTSSVIEAPIYDITASTSTLTESGVKLGDSIQLNILRSQVIKNLLESKCVFAESSQVLNEIFIDSLGVLRMVDYLSIAEEVDIWKPHFVYLFEYSLLLVEETSASYKLIELQNSDSSKLSTSVRAASSDNVCVKISTPSASLIKLQCLSREVSFTLTCKSQSVIEKWGAVLSNLDIALPIDLFSSTLDISKPNPLSIGFEPITVQESDVRRSIELIELNSCSFNNDAEGIFLVVNVTNFKASSLLILKNIVRALILVKEEICLVLTSSPTLDNFTSVLTDELLYRRGPKDDKDKILDLIEQMEDLQSSERQLRMSFDNFLAQTSFSNQDVCCIVLSDANLDNFTSPVSQAILLLLDVQARHINNFAADKSIQRIGTWDEAMEILCFRLGLDFDNSDLDSSSSTYTSSNLEESNSDSCDDSDSSVRGLNIGAERLTFNEVSANDNNDNTKWNNLIEDIDTALGQI